MCHCVCSWLLSWFIAIWCTICLVVTNSSRADNDSINFNGFIYVHFYFIFLSKTSASDIFSSDLFLYSLVVISGGGRLPRVRWGRGEGRDEDDVVEGREGQQRERRLWRKGIEIDLKLGQVAQLWEPCQELSDLEGCRPHIPQGQVRGMIGTAKEVGHCVVGGALSNGLIGAV